VTLSREVQPEPKRTGGCRSYQLHQKPGQLRILLGGGDVQLEGKRSVGPDWRYAGVPMARTCRGHTRPWGQRRHGSAIALRDLDGMGARTEDGTIVAASTHRKRVTY